MYFMDESWMLGVDAATEPVCPCASCKSAAKARRGSSEQRKERRPSILTWVLEASRGSTKSKGKKQPDATRSLALLV